MHERKRYVVVGTGARSSLYTYALFSSHREYGQLVGMCDINSARMDYYNRQFAQKFDGRPLPTFSPAQFDQMIRETRADAVIVTSVDRTHHRYICRAMELGCDVISEKPLTVDVERCQAILDAIKRTGKQLIMAFNYRYAPRNSKIRQLLQEGAIGRVFSIHFEWLLDTSHGADYFRRWHRDKRNSGGLMVHKSTHHFDLVNWWLRSTPQTVFGIGNLCFYGRENAEERGVRKFYDRCFGRASENAAGDPFAIKLEDANREIYFDAEGEDGYLRDQSVFGDGISIEDDMSVMVQYANKAVMTYHLTAYSPWEGFRIAFNGSKGRLEYDVMEKPILIGSGADPSLRPGDVVLDKASVEPVHIRICPHWGRPVNVEIPPATGGHGGGDPRLLDDLFIGKREEDPLGRAADFRDGVTSVLTGIAANRSFATGQPVDVASLVRID